MKNYSSPVLAVIDITKMEGVFACTNPYSNGWNSGSFYSGGSASTTTPSTGSETQCHPYNPCPPIEESDDDGCPTPTKPRKRWWF